MLCHWHVLSPTRNHREFASQLSCLNTLSSAAGVEAHEHFFPVKQQLAMQFI